MLVQRHMGLDTLFQTAWHLGSFALHSLNSYTYIHGWVICVVHVCNTMYLMNSMDGLRGSLGSGFAHRICFDRSEAHWRPEPPFVSRQADQSRTKKHTLSTEASHWGWSKVSHVLWGPFSDGDLDPR